MGFQLFPVSPRDPQVNGFVENFVKTILKLLHTAAAEHKNPKVELYKFLLHYQATPHSSTDKSPVEILYNMKLRTKLPQVFSLRETKAQQYTREIHNYRKMKQKENVDKNRGAKSRCIEIGDKVLIKQNKTTTKPPFEPISWKVKSTKGNFVLAMRPNRSTRVHDKNQNLLCCLSTF